MIGSVLISMVEIAMEVLSHIKQTNFYILIVRRWLHTSTRCGVVMEYEQDIIPRLIMLVT
jgi:hypothetical protein